MQDFEQALERLRAAAAKIAPTPLSEARYAETHDVFEAASAQRARIATFLDHELSALLRPDAAPLEMLSLGCGGGALDAELLRRPHNVALGYLGVDVSAASLARFPQDALSRPDRRLLHVDALSLPEDRRFDLVTAIHMIYYVADKTALIRKAQALTKPGGRTILAVAPLSPMNRIADVFWRDRPGAATFYADDLAALLERLGARVERETIEAGIPLARYRGGDRALIDFTVQAETAALTPAVQEALTAALEAAAVPGEDGAPWLAHPVDMFQL